MRSSIRIASPGTSNGAACAGILDQVFDIRLIFLHFWFNVLALTLPLMVFAWYGMRKDLRSLLRGKQEPA
jgi:hypothetical protein